MRKLDRPFSGIYELTCLITQDKYIGQSAFLYRREWDHFYKLKKGQVRHLKTYPGLIAPDGMIYQKIENLNKFCREHDLHRPLIYCVLNGARPHHKGWRALCAK